MDVDGNITKYPNSNQVSQAQMLVYKKLKLVTRDQMLLVI